MDDLIEKIPVVYPTKNSEADVQFELYYKLKNLGYDVKAEVKLKTSNRFETSHLRGARFDLVVFVDKEAKIIIEVKKKNNGKASKQEKHYSSLTGLPVLVCGGSVQIDQVITSISQILNKAADISKTIL